jgi:hypothetical protein
MRLRCSPISTPPRDKRFRERDIRSDEGVRHINEAVLRGKGTTGDPQRSELELGGSGRVFS